MARGSQQAPLSGGVRTAAAESELIYWLNSLPVPSCLVLSSADRIDLDLVRDLSGHLFPDICIQSSADLSLVLEAVSGHCGGLTLSYTEPWKDARSWAEALFRYSVGDGAEAQPPDEPFPAARRRSGGTARQARHAGLDSRHQDREEDTISGSFSVDADYSRLSEPSSRAADSVGQTAEQSASRPLSTSRVAFEAFTPAKLSIVGSSREDSPLSSKSRSGSPLRFASDLLASRRKVLRSPPLGPQRAAATGQPESGGAANAGRRPRPRPRARSRRTGRAWTEEPKPEWNSSTMLQPQNQCTSDGKHESPAASPVVSPVESLLASGRGRLTDKGLIVGGMLDPSPGSSSSAHDARTRDRAMSNSRNSPVAPPGGKPSQRPPGLSKLPRRKASHLAVGSKIPRRLGSADRRRVRSASPSQRCGAAAVKEDHGAVGWTEPQDKTELDAMQQEVLIWLKMMDVDIGDLKQGEHGELRTHKRFVPTVDLNAAIGHGCLVCSVVDTLESTNIRQGKSAKVNVNRALEVLRQRKSINIRHLWDGTALLQGNVVRTSTNSYTLSQWGEFRDCPDMPVLPFRRSRLSCSRTFGFHTNEKHSRQLTETCRSVWPMVVLPTGCGSDQMPPLLLTDTSMTVPHRTSGGQLWAGE